MIETERWANRFDVLFLEIMYKDDGYSKERAVLKDFIRKEISLATADERKKVVEEIRIIADTTPPNLLLNAITSRV